eukprot:1142670-Pelagomonas_calceolata.AAC.3
MGVVLHLVPVVDEASPSLSFIDRAISLQPFIWVMSKSRLWTEVFLYSQTLEAWHSELRGLMTGGAVWSVWAGRRVADFASMASTCCAWGVGLCWDASDSALTGIRSWIILAKGLRRGRGGVF